MLPDTSAREPVFFPFFTFFTIFFPIFSKISRFFSHFFPFICSPPGPKTQVPPGAPLVYAVPGVVLGGDGAAAPPAPRWHPWVGVGPPLRGGGAKASRANQGGGRGARAQWAARAALITRRGRGGGRCAAGRAPRDGTATATSLRYPRDIPATAPPVAAVAAAAAPHPAATRRRGDPESLAAKPPRWSSGSAVRASRVPRGLPAPPGGPPGA